MNWLWLVSYFFGGRFCGKRHPSFCRRHDGTSLPESLRQTTRQRALLLNGQRCLGILQRAGWYLLVAHVGAFNPRTTSHILAFGLGALLISISSARHFGQFHGGNTPSRT